MTDPLRQAVPLADRFETTSIDVSTFLVAVGHAVLLEPLEDDQQTFVFVFPAEARSDAADFAAGTAQIDPRKVARAAAAVRGKIRSERRRLATGGGR
jgi:hypothetical protein